MVPINCDYEILSPLTWVVVNIWALPYWTILVLFVYFWNKMMFKIYAVVHSHVVERLLMKQTFSRTIALIWSISSHPYRLFYCCWQIWLINTVSALSGWLWGDLWLLFGLHMSRDVADLCVRVHMHVFVCVHLVFRSSVIHVSFCPRGLSPTHRETIKAMTLESKADHNIHLYLLRK